MEKCDQCGNAYEHTFHVTMKGSAFTFDSFECAIEKLAPRCHQCSTRIMGHGLESNERLYCCANCARNEGVVNLKDHEKT